MQSIPRGFDVRSVNWAAYLKVTDGSPYVRRWTYSGVCAGVCRDNRVAYTRACSNHSKHTRLALGILFNTMPSRLRFST